MRVALVVAFGYGVAGCALVDTKVNLNYEAPKATSATREAIVLEQPREVHGLDRNDQGRLIVGTVKNGFGVTTADVLTEDSIPKWITEALRAELAALGYPTMVGGKRSVRVKCEILRVWVDSDPSFWSYGAIGEVDLRIEVHRGHELGDFHAKGPRLCMPGFESVLL